jgi:hypothetical protein
MRNDGIESLSSYRDLGGLPMISSDLFTCDSEGTPCRYGVPAALDQDPFPAPAVEFPVEDALPRAKDFGELSRAVEPAAGYRHHAAHDLPFEVGVGVVYTGAIVQPAFGRRNR